MRSEAGMQQASGWGRFAAALVAVAVVGVTGTGRAGAAPVVTGTGLGDLGAPASEALAINDAGQVVGWGAVTSYDDRHAFSWTAARGMVDLGTLPGTARSEAVAVSDTGQVVGNSYIPASDEWDPDVTQAFSWTAAGGMVAVGTLGGPSSVATAVNDHGLVVGWSTTADGSTHAFSWTAAGGIVDLGTLSGFGQSYAADVNDSGQVVGQSTRAGGEDHAFVWTATGGMVSLGDLGGALGYSSATAINEGGQVVGQSSSPDGWSHAFSWTSAGGMLDLGTLGGTSSYAMGVSDTGHVVGNSDTTTGYPHAFLWTSPGEGMVDIPTFGGPIAEGWAVNDAGQVVGRAYTPDNELLAFSWTAAGGLIDLGGGVWSIARAVNDAGQIAGSDETGAARLWEVCEDGCASQTVSGGETVTTDPDGTGPTPDVPVQTAIQVPDGVSGQLTIVPLPSSPPPTGFELLGQALELTGPPAPSAASPYTVTFTVDGSALGPTAPADIEVFRDGVAAADCVDPQAADPDPCVVARGLVPDGGGDAYVTVRTTHFSTWALGAPEALSYDVTGPFQPVDQLPTTNVVKPGSAVPVRFSLDGDQGLDVFEPGSPASSTVDCSGGPADSLESTVSAGSSSLTYDPGSDTYTYAWKTNKMWRGCRILVVTFRDGSRLEAKFSFG